MLPLTCNINIVIILAYVYGILLCDYSYSYKYTETELSKQKLWQQLNHEQIRLEKGIIYIELLECQLQYATII